MMCLMTVLIAFTSRGVRRRCRNYFMGPGGGARAMVCTRRGAEIWRFLRDADVHVERILRDANVERFLRGVDVSFARGAEAWRFLRGADVERFSCAARRGGMGGVVAARVEK